uniref:Ubiquitin-like domain-containing protein n=1 Tax=Alexandrium andersonii TaxID=327968 RepID=A0A7S2GRJ5_9DINO|mmetsp:Transcript_6122/g.13927  ORF Transcript_6122/g.13927 Transcript_6122/m.13927 type:complete len:163 (+) Transcript_6122:134-622(+)
MAADLDFDVCVHCAGAASKVVSGNRPDETLKDLIARIELALDQHSGREKYSQLSFNGKVLDTSQYGRRLDELGIGKGAAVSFTMAEGKMPNPEGGPLAGLRLHQALNNKKFELSAPLKTTQEKASCKECAGVQEKHDSLSYFGGNHERCPACARILVHDIGN